jgi:hypothetical protein
MAPPKNIGRIHSTEVDAVGHAYTSYRHDASPTLYWSRSAEVSNEACAKSVGGDTVILEPTENGT